MFISATGAALAMAAAPRAIAQWQPSERYPDPSVKIIDPSFGRYRIAQTKVERIASGMRWCEGPVWIGDDVAFISDRNDGAAILHAACHAAHTVCN